MIYGQRETEAEAVERKFSAICRAWHAEKAAGRKPKRAMMEIGRTEFGLTQAQTEEICAKATRKVWRGISSDTLIEIMEGMAKASPRAA